MAGWQATATEGSTDKDTVQLRKLHLLLLVVVDLVVPEDGLSSKYQSVHVAKTETPRMQPFFPRASEDEAEELASSSRCRQYMRRFLPHPPSLAPGPAQTKRMQQRSTTYLVAVAPEVVLGADVLVVVFDALLHGRGVGGVLPVLVPEPVGVGAREDQAGGDEAGGRKILV